jgi:hypothetical protein
MDGDVQQHDQGAAAVIDPTGSWPSRWACCEAASHIVITR